MTPIIELLSYHYEIKLIKVKPDYDYDNDNNMIYINKNLSNVKVYDLFLDKNYIYKKLSYIYNKFSKLMSNSINKCNKIFYYIIGGLIRRIYLNKKLINEIEICSLLGVDDINNWTVVTDISSASNNYERIKDYVNKSDITHITFAHAFQIGDNKLYGYHLLSLDVKTDVSGQKRKNFSMDKYILFNSLDKLTVENTYNVTPEVFPSLRYSTKWINKINDRGDTYKIQNQKEYKLKMVFMLSTAGANTWKEEELRTIKAILLHENIFLAVKLHPRDIRSKNRYLKIKDENFQVVSNEITSSSLIEWSDIVVNNGSGIIMEAIIRRKPVFYMKYLHCNSILIEKTKNIMHQIHTRDELLKLIELYKINKNQDFIDESEVKDFLKGFIGNDNYDENQNIYLNFFKNL